MDCVCGQKLLLCGKTPGHLCVKHEDYGQKAIKNGYRPKLCLQKWCRYLNNCSSLNPEWKDKCSLWFYHHINVYVSIHHPEVDLYWWEWAEWVSGHLHVSCADKSSFSILSYSQVPNFLQALQTKPHSWKVGWMHPNHEHRPVTKTGSLFLCSAGVAIVVFWVNLWTISPLFPELDSWASDKLMGRT